MECSEKYLVSAIVSTYNSERFIRGCLEDLEAQTIADKLEIIVVNSGSEQNEEAIVRELKDKYDNIKYIKTEQRETVYQAWNRGIKVASGKYITNANTDDSHKKDCLEILVKALEDNSDKVLAYADSIITKVENETFDRCTPVDYWRWPDFNRKKLLEYCCIGPQPVWRRSIHDEMGYFDEGYQCSGDYEFWLRIAQKYKFVHIPEPLGLYYLSEDTVSRKGELPLTETSQIQKEYKEKYRELLKNNNIDRIIPQKTEQGLKILYVVHEFPPQPFGGTGGYTYSVSKEMQKKGHEVWVAYPAKPSTNEYACNVTTYDGIGVVEIQIPQGRNIVLTVKDDELGACFEEHLKSHSYDLVHFQHLKGLSGNLIEVAKRLNIPCILTLHDFWFMCHTDHLFRFREELCSGPESVDKCVACFLKSYSYILPLPNITFQEIANIFYSLAYRAYFLRDMLKLPDRIFSPSNYLKGVFAKYGIDERKIEVRPLGVSLVEDYVKTDRKKMVRFAFLGNISKVKGLDYLIDAFRRVSGQLTLAIYGKVHESQPLEKIKQLSNISYKGVYTHADLPRIFSGTDVVIVPSLNESYSLVVREALSAGIPVIASKVGGIPEIIEDGRNGVLFEAGNIEELSQKIESLVSNPAKIDELRENIKAVKNIAEEIAELEDTYYGLTPKKTQNLQQRLCSIIIPVFNKVEYTRQCLEALIQNTPDNLYEVVIIDNASTDGTKEFLACLEGDVKIITNEENLGFAKACNQGVREASGKYLVFLNNDTVPQPGWLEEMVKLVESDESIGIVGSKLLYPDGTIQHAGLVFGFNKIPYHIYTRKDSQDKCVNKIREFSAVTGACLAISKELFIEVGLFDEGYKNGTEDIDLCLKVKEKNKKIIYAPDSVVCHFESKTEGRFKHINENRKRFLERWGNKIQPDDYVYFSEDNLVNEFLETNYKMAQQLMGGNFFDEAIRALEYIATFETSFKKALGDDSKYLDVVFNLGKCFQAKENFDKAIEWYQKALSLDNENIEILNRLGDCFDRKENIIPLREEKKTSSLILNQPSLGRKYKISIISFSDFEKNKERRLRWGDFWVKYELQKEIEKLGHIVDDKDPDIILHLFGAPIRDLPEAPHKIIWIHSHPDWVSPEVLNRYDQIYCLSPKFLKKIRDWGFKAELLVGGTAKTPVDTERLYDIVFVGNTKGSAGRKIIRDLGNISYNLKVWGEGWEKILSPEYYGGLYYENEKLAELYASASIVLNDHHEDMRREGFLNPRIFDVFASGSLVISDAIGGIKSIFGDALPIYHTPQDLRTMIDYYIRNPRERRKAVEKGMLVACSYTFEKILQSILDGLPSTAPGPIRLYGTSF